LKYLRNDGEPLKADALGIWLTVVVVDLPGCYQ